MMEEIKELIDYGIMGTLLFMSFVALAVGIERYLSIRSTKVENFKSKAQLEKELTKRLYIIATVASNAPYVGLLGTVLGILLTFYIIGEKGIVNTKEIMVGLALALKATALGLIVAIPSTILYNFLVRKVREKLLDWEAIHGECSSSHE
ncbi:biopolymer transport exbB [Aquifex aeolicus VF5]|uniref:Biopolymer transport protein ExbB n=2 Tax=Aquifex aeolicus TaxID=63363 RepID=EXBB_AQUAE|nr:RecName: Full=Biopolymer transport protein ExbB [Aquifex aeolicus VF5]AAC07592.1 biopolymer transport exbB [Aquifex aeolicus VF5]